MESMLIGDKLVELVVEEHENISPVSNNLVIDNADDNDSTFDLCQGNVDLNQSIQYVFFQVDGFQLSEADCKVDEDEGMESVLRGDKLVELVVEKYENVSSVSNNPLINNADDNDSTFDLCQGNTDLNQSIQYVFFQADGSQLSEADCKANDTDWRGGGEKGESRKGVAEKTGKGEDKGMNPCFHREDDNRGKKNKSHGKYPRGSASAPTIKLQVVLGQDDAFTWVLLLNRGEPKFEHYCCKLKNHPCRDHALRAYRLGASKQL
ncbi:hypothetical protein SUGI_0610930 [Cryptomeria japonica]|nr:hypothetical protein SUGI_0610930 [Cryptomeria japonica]